MLGDHWQLSKYSYFDQTFHVPLIVRDPHSEAARRGRVVDAFTESVDVMPTIVDWLGLEIPSTCDGESLLGLCRSEESIPWRSEAHFALDFRNFTDDNEGPILGLKPDQCAFTALRDEHFKYVHFTALPPLFFDLNEDPMEFNNVAEVPAYQEQILEYAQKLISWRMNHEDRGLTHVRLTPTGPVTHLDRRR